MLLSEGQMSDYKGAALMIEALPRATELLGGLSPNAASWAQTPTDMSNTSPLTRCVARSTSWARATQ